MDRVLFAVAEKIMDFAKASKTEKNRIRAVK